MFVLYWYECLLVVLACESVHVGDVKTHGFVWNFVWKFCDI